MSALVSAHCILFRASSAGCSIPRVLRLLIYSPFCFQTSPLLVGSVLFLTLARLNPSSVSLHGDLVHDPPSAPEGFILRSVSPTERGGRRCLWRRRCDGEDGCEREGARFINQLAPLTFRACVLLSEDTDVLKGLSSKIRGVQGLKRVAVVGLKDQPVWLWKWCHPTNMRHNAEQRKGVNPNNTLPLSIVTGL